MTVLDQLVTRRVAKLPSELVDQIAAGEVVERPSSVVKELVENAIDAGARTIDLVLVNGGRKRIEIADDGCGMSPQDAELSIERHATSKIRSFDDLTKIATLGFRGEALPSIASVSNFRLLTSDREDGSAFEILIDAGRDRIVRPAVRDRGTTIRVDDLFENVPARKKFLKSADAEFRSIVTIVSSYALVEPLRSFRVTHNDRVVLDFPPARDARERFLQILGNEAAPHLADVSIEIGDVTVEGLVTRTLRYGSRRNQFFFVNGRLVRDRVLTHAANRAAEQFDREGNPAICLFVEIDPTLVDVNVHPAKTEVRFRDSSRVHVAVESGVRRALGAPEEGVELLRENPDVPSFFGAPSHPPGVATEARVPCQQTGMAFSTGVRDTRAANPFLEASPLFRQASVVQPPREHTHADLGDLRGRVLGQYRQSYIVVDAPEGLRLIDQHAAHERVLYERFVARGEEVTSQALLEPFIHDAGVSEAALLESHLDELREAGFEIERFSRSSFAISAVPAMLGRATNDLERFLTKLLDAAHDDLRHLAKVRDRVAASMACQAAIKVHRPMSGSEMSTLVADLLRCENPFACPHGRPVIVDIRHLDIEKHFHRK